MKDKVIIGMDVGGTKTRIGAVRRDENGEAVLAFPCEIFSSEALKTDDPADIICGWYAEYLRKQGISEEQAETLSIGLPASVRNDFKTVFQAPNTADGHLNGMRLSDVLSEKISVGTHLI